MPRPGRTPGRPKAHVHGLVASPCAHLCSCDEPLCPGHSCLWTKALNLDLSSEPRQAGSQAGGRDACSFSLGSIGYGNPGSRTKDRGLCLTNTMGWAICDQYCAGTSQLQGTCNQLGSGSHRTRQAEGRAGRTYRCQPGSGTEGLQERKARDQHSWGQMDMVESSWGQTDMAPIPGLP